MRSSGARQRTWVSAVVIAVALIAGSVGALPAEASSVPGQVTGVKVIGQDWTNRTVKVQWSKVTGATSYAAKWSTDSHFTKPVWGSTTGTSLSIGTLTPAATYYLVVAAKNAAGSGRYSTTTQVKLKPAPVSTFGSVSVRATATGVRVSFSAVPNASDYRVRWSAGPNENRVPDRWQEHYSSWFTAFGRTGTLTYDVPMSSADLTSTPYGNPIYVRLQARNTYYDKTYIRKSVQVHAWPTPTAPAHDGYTLKIASYNVMCSTCEPAGSKTWSARVGALAANIEQSAPDVLGVQEASGPATSSSALPAYQDLDNHLAGLQLTYAGAAPDGATESGTRIFYNPRTVKLLSQGYLPGILDYRTYPQSTAQQTSIPYAEFSLQADPTRRFLAVSAHYGLPATGYGSAKKALLGQDSSQLLRALDSLVMSDSALRNIPIVLTGDLNDHRYPENETDGAQATLIRGGFYDMSASMLREGTDKPTYNALSSPSAQVSDPNQDGLRIDYILARGLSGSIQFENAWNPGLPIVPSDHNLLSTTVRFPTD